MPPFRSVVLENMLTYNVTYDEAFLASVNCLQNDAEEYTRWLRSATLTTFEFNGYAFALVRGDFEHPSEPLVLVRYERSPDAKFVRKGLTLRCRDRPDTCTDIPYKCNGMRIGDDEISNFSIQFNTNFQMRTRSGEAF